MTLHRILIATMLICAACELPPRSQQSELRVQAARYVTRQYAHSPLAAWNVRASAAGRDCDVLLLTTSIAMEDTMVEALHYGGGDYSVLAGSGVERYNRTRGLFRGVAYRDATARLWTYGVTPDEAQALQRCS